MHPVLLDFAVPIYTYGTLVAVAFLLGLKVALDRAKAEGVPADLVANVFMAVLLGAVLGARLLYVAEHWGYYRFRLVEILFVHHGGLSFFGGLIGGVALGALALRKPLGFLQATDLFAPSLALGQSIGRLGCYFNGCCYGRVHSGPFAVLFPGGSAVHADHVAAGLIGPADAYALPVVPTQLLSSGMDLALFAFLVIVHARRRVHGTTFFTYLLAYGLLRFGMEFLRMDNAPMAWGLNLPQLLSLAGILLGGSGLLLHRRVRRA